MPTVTYTKSGTTTSVAVNTTTTVYGTTKVQFCESLAARHASARAACISRCICMHQPLHLHASAAASAQSMSPARPHPCMPLTVSPRRLIAASAWSSGALTSSVRIYNSKISASAYLRNAAPLNGVASTAFTFYRLDVTLYTLSSPLTPPIAGLLGEGGEKSGDGGGEGCSA